MGARLDPRLERALLGVKESLKDCFLRAWLSDPGLVKEESKFNLFLVLERGDADKAARRLCSYWQVRVEIFRDRACFPICLLGKGILTTEEVRMLHSGLVASVPRGFNGGSSVLLVNTDKMPKGCHVGDPTWRRLIFYTLHLLGEKGEGFIVLLHSKSADLSRVNVVGLLTVYDLLMNSFFYRPKSIHMALSSGSTQFPTALVDRIKLATAEKVVLHNFSPKILEALTECGFKEESLPPCLGGTWSLESHVIRVQEIKDAEEVDSEKRGSSLDVLHEAVVEVLNGHEYRDQDHDHLDDLPHTELLNQQLLDAIKMLPSNLKEAYLDAQRRCPELIQAESEPTRFLKFDRYDPWAAGRRLASYWTERVDIFGNRAFLPLTRGAALIDDDLQIMDSECLVILPNDAKGRSVLYLDRSLLPGDTYHLRQHKIRVLFTRLSEITKNDSSQEEGFRLLVRMVKSGPRDFDRYMLGKFLGLVNNTFPVRIFNLHFANVLESNLKMSQWLAAQAVSFIGPLASKVANFDFHSTPKELICALESHGFVASGLPAELGGARSNTKGQIPRFISEEAKVTAKVQLEEALKVIPKSEKSAYIEALKISEDLVQNESNYLLFLRREKYDVWAAAKRLVRYWDMRKRFFGKRAYLPMILTGTGALSPDDIKVLDTGYLVLLPHDYIGRPVFYYDPSRLTSDARERRIRCLFYLLHVATMTSERPAEDGFVGITSMNTLGFQRTSGLESPQDLVEFAMPIRMAYGHVLPCTQQFGIDWFVQKMLPVLLSLLRHVASNVMVHTKAKSENLNNLVKAGLKESDLPTTAGGKWTYESDFTKWKDARIQQEREMHGLPIAPEETMGAIYSRRKRARQKERVDTLKSDCKRLKETNQVLRAEHSSLTSRLEQAKSNVRLLEMQNGNVAPSSMMVPAFLTHQQQQSQQLQQQHHQPQQQQQQAQMVAHPQLNGPMPAAAQATQQQSVFGQLQSQIQASFFGFQLPLIRHLPVVANRTVTTNTNDTNIGHNPAAVGFQQQQQQQGHSVPLQHGNIHLQQQPPPPPPLQQGLAPQPPFETTGNAKPVDQSLFFAPTPFQPQDLDR